MPSIVGFAGRDRLALAAMKIATWNINGVRARIDSALTWLKDATARHRLPAGDQIGGRVLPVRDVRGARLQRRHPRPEGLQRRRPALQAAAGGCVARPARRRRRRSRPLHRGGGLGAGGRAARRLALPAERQSDRHRQVRLQARLDGAARSLRPPTPRWRRRRSCSPATSTSSRNRSTRASRTTGADDALFQPETRARLPRAPQPRPDRRLPRLRAGPGHYTFWDYQAGAWQKNNGIRIDHMLLSPQAADRLVGASIDKRTRGWEKPPTTCRWWSNSTLRMNPTREPALRHHPLMGVPLLFSDPSIFQSANSRSRNTATSSWTHGGGALLRAGRAAIKEAFNGWGNTAPSIRCDGHNVTSCDLHFAGTSCPRRSTYASVSSRPTKIASRPASREPARRGAAVATLRVPSTRLHSVLPAAAHGDLEPGPHSVTLMSAAVRAS